MKPLRSLMGLALAVLLLASRAVAAPWVQVDAGGKKYFLPQDRYTLLEKGKVGAAEALYPEAGAAKKSQAVLKKKSQTDYVVLIPNTTEVAVSSVAPIEVPAKTKPAKTKAPAKKKQAAKPKADQGAFDPIAAAKADSAIPQARRESVVKFLEKLKADNPAEYAKLKTPADVSALAKKFLDADDKVGKGDLAKTYASLYPSKPADNGGGVSDPSADPGAGGKKTVKPDTVQGVAVDGAGKDGTKGEQGSATDLVFLLAKRMGEAPEQTKASLSDRLYKFLTEDDKRYVADAVRGKSDVMANLKTWTGAWVETQIKENKVGDLAVIYVVMGSGPKVPEWAVKDPVKEKDLVDLLQKGARLEKLKKAMENAGWTQKPMGGKAGQVTAGKQEEISAFFADAPAGAKTGGVTFWAKVVLGETRTDADLKLSIIKNEEKPTVPGATGGGGPILKDPMKAFGFESLYTKGGVDGLVYAPGDPVSRRMSMKLYTSREADGRLVTKIGIYDITDKGAIFGQRFDIPNGTGEFTFALDDRKPGYPKYTLKYSPDGDGIKVTFSREGGKGGVLESGLSDLYKKRAQQAVDEGVPVTVGGQKYLALGQGSAAAGLVFFPADTGSRLNDGETVDAALYSNTTGKTGGRDVNLPGKRHLGTVDGKDYHLAFNDKLKYWEVKEGKGDDLAKPSTQTTATNPGGNTTPGGTTQTTQQPDGTQVTTPDQVADFELNELKSGEWEVNEEVTKGLADQYKSKIRVYSYTHRSNKEPDRQIGREIGARHRVFDANLPKGWAYLPFFNPTKDDMLRKKGEVRGIGKYLAVTTDQFTGYLNLSKMNENPQTAHYLYDIDPTCMVWEPANKSDARTFCIKDAVLLEDALTRVGAPEEMRKTVLANAQKLGIAGGDPNLMKIESKWDKEAKPKPTWGPVIAVVTGKGTANLWPKLVEWNQVGEADGDTKNPTGGQTNSFNTVAGPNAEFPTEPQTVDNQGKKGTAHFVKKSDDGMVALYGDNADPAKSKSWYIMTKIKLNDGKTARTGFVQVFSETDKFPGLDKLSMKGSVVPKHEDAGGQRDVISTGGIRKAAKGEAGVFYAVENKNVATPDTGTSANKYANCMGPVLWWGVDEKKAVQVCKDNKFD